MPKTITRRKAINIVAERMIEILDDLKENIKNSLVDEDRITKTTDLLQELQLVRIRLWEYK